VISSAGPNHEPRRRILDHLQLMQQNAWQTAKKRIAVQGTAVLHASQVTINKDNQL